MPVGTFPKWFSECITTNDEALRRVVCSGTRLLSGFATSEPHTFYAGLWEHIQEQDIVDLKITQALFMAPHALCVGDALSSKGLFPGVAERFPGPFSNLFRRVNDVTRKIEGLGKLIEHYRDLQERRIVFHPAFIGSALNTIIPRNPITRAKFPDFMDRNTTRMGIADMQVVHFPDAVDSMAYNPDGEPLADAVVLVLTPPDENGEMSHGPSNGATAEALEAVLERQDMTALLYVNPKYPFTRGYAPWAPNTVQIDRFRGLAQQGRLIVVEDEGKIPATPPGAFSAPTEVEKIIAENLVNHIELNSRFTYGRALQVGIGRTGIQAIRLLKDSGWTGRVYTEMLEPFTLELMQAGKIAGSHFIERDGTRTQLDGKIVCTFTMGEEGSDFYEKLHNNPAVVLAPASRVVIPEAFHGGLGINNCLSIDFHGQVNAGSRHRNHHSGIGGLAMINRGLGVGGVGYLCLKSTHRSIDGKVISSILPFHPEGTAIGLIGPDLVGGRQGARKFVVTEHGVAQVSGCSQSELIRELIRIADPRFQNRLKMEAWNHFRVQV